jgi:hypothetical protein
MRISFLTLPFPLMCRYVSFHAGEGFAADERGQPQAYVADVDVSFRVVEYFAADYFFEHSWISPNEH